VIEVGPPRAVLAPRASRDLRDVLRWSEAKFGYEAKVRYQALIIQAFRDIERDFARHGSIERPQIMIDGARTYHISFSRYGANAPRGIVHKPRHILLYRRRDDGVIDIARILHDGRDIQKHLPKNYRRM
jgi:toxin ParE1/3/4